MPRDRTSTLRLRLVPALLLVAAAGLLTVGFGGVTPAEPTTVDAEVAIVIDMPGAYDCPYARDSRIAFG